VDDEAREFEQLFREHYDAVLGYALTRAADVDSAKDVAARTFLVAWMHRNDWHGFDSPRGWLLGVARRTLADQRRSAARYTKLQRRLGQYEMTAPRAPDPGDIVGDHQRVASAFGRLRPVDRDVLALIAWDGLSSAEAATVMGCSRAAFAVRLHRARSRLRVQLQLVDGSEPRGDGACLVSLAASASLNREKT
jgi:RNA polymerase sigma-70 factor, ECF subfamily